MIQTCREKAEKEAREKDIEWKLIFHKQVFLNGFSHILVGIYGPDWMNTKAAFWVPAASYIWKNPVSLL